MCLGVTRQGASSLSDANKHLMHGTWAGNRAFDEEYGSSWALASPPPPLLYQVLTTDGATCPAGTEITSLAECSAAIAEANAAMGASPWDGRSGTVGTQSDSFYPKGCTSRSYDDYYGYT